LESLQKPFQWYPHKINFTLKNKNFSYDEYSSLIKQISQSSQPNQILDILKQNWIIISDNAKIDGDFKKRLIIWLKIARSNLIYRKLLEEGYLTNQCLLREKVLKRLQILNKKLKKLGLQIKIISGYRNPVVQNEARKIFAQINWKWYNFVASKSPHSTWWAFDVELLTFPEWKPLSTKFPDFLKRRETSSDVYSENLETEPNLPTEYKQIVENRRLLYNLMKESGFIGHYKEYWHFGLGDPLSEYIRAKRQKKSPQVWYWIVNLQK